MIWRRSSDNRQSRDGLERTATRERDDRRSRFIVSPGSLKDEAVHKLSRCAKQCGADDVAGYIDVEHA